MSELIQRAIAHIDDQAEKSTNPLCKSIAQYIIDNCLGSEENAKRALESGKDLKKCAAHVTSNARKEAVSGCAVVEDSVVWRWVREYYLFDDMQSNAKPAHTPVSLLDFM